MVGLLTGDETTVEDIIEAVERRVLQLQLQLDKIREHPYAYEQGDEEYTMGQIDAFEELLRAI